MRIRNKKLTSSVLIAVFFVAGVSAYAAEQGEIARIITRITPPISVIQKPEEKGEIFTNTYYEFSDVTQGSRTGSWREVTNLFGYGRGKIKGYFSVSQLRRFDQRNYTANFGGYLSMDDSYLHFETGFGWDISYIYRLQNIIEYGHKMHKNLYWQLGYNYRAYPKGDTNLMYPSIIYYFGNSYVSATYAASVIESRGTGNMGIAKCDIAINDYIHWWAGGAYGEWVYDIDGLPANDEFGYLAFSGFTFNLCKNISARIGYSYGGEKPKFSKKGMTFDLAFKF